MPKDFELSGPEETLTVRVHYDTKQLYGKLSATRDIRIAR